MKLELVKTENFEEYPCDFYRDVNQDIYLNREQIGTALEYADPSKAIRKIHMAHKDRLEPLCVRVKIDGAPQIGATLTKREEQECVYYSERGIMEICRWSRQKKANQFMDWAWDIIEAYRKHELTVQKEYTTQILNSIDLLTQSMTTLTSTIANFQEQLHTLQEDVDYIKKVQEDRHMKRTKLPSSWYVSMAPKYKLLMEHFHCSRSKIYSSIYRKLETQYGIKIKDVYDDYCITNHLTHNDCYPMTAIEADENLREIVSDIVDHEIIDLGILSEEELKNMDQNLFDRVAS